jgi:hypothetical protein
MTNNELYEGTDKAAFLEWLQQEGFIAAVDKAEVNKICQRWIKHKIALGAPKADKPVKIRRVVDADGNGRDVVALKGFEVGIVIDRGHPASLDRYANLSAMAEALNKFWQYIPAKEVR